MATMETQAQTMCPVIPCLQMGTLAPEGTTSLQTCTLVNVHGTNTSFRQSVPPVSCGKFTKARLADLLTLLVFPYHCSCKLSL